MPVLRALRSFMAIVACLLTLGVAAPLTLYLVVVPLGLLRPAQEREIGIKWVSTIARLLVRILKAGGASIETEGEIDCAQPGVVIMNHQSVLEIAPLIHIMKKRLPRFVARSRYARGVPTVSRAIAFLDCIVIDPRRNRAGAVLSMKHAAEQGLDHVVMLFPEGHRTKDGEVAPFRPAGMVALLAGRQLPVWVIVSDGFWRLRKVLNTFFGLGSVKGRMKVVEKVISPENPDELPAFIEERRQTMIRELEKMRAEAAT